MIEKKFWPVTIIKGYIGWFGSKTFKSFHLCLSQQCIQISENSEGDAQAIGGGIFINFKTFEEYL